MNRWAQARSGFATEMGVLSRRGRILRDSAPEFPHVYNAKPQRQIWKDISEMLNKCKGCLYFARN